MNFRINQALIVFQNVLRTVYFLSLFVLLPFLCFKNIIPLFMIVYAVTDFGRTPEEFPKWRDLLADWYFLALLGYIAFIIIVIRFKNIQARKDPAHHKLAMKHLLVSTDILNPNSYIRKNLPKRGIVKAYPIQLDIDDQTITVPSGVLNFKQRQLNWDDVMNIEFGITTHGASLLIFSYKQGKTEKQTKCKRRLIATDYKKLLPLLVAYFGDKLNFSNGLGED